MTDAEKIEFYRFCAAWLYLRAKPSKTIKAVIRDILLNNNGSVWTKERREEVIKNAMEQIEKEMKC